MTHQSVIQSSIHPESQAAPAAWGAVFAMALCVAVLIASEFMPVSLLSPIAGDLGITDGRAGQAISVSGIFAVVTSLFVSNFTRRIDRRFVLVSLSLILVISGLVVTFAQYYSVLMVGRALLGVAIGGFWSMSTAIVMRLVPADSVPQALATLNAGNAIAATISAPLGSMLGSYVGWRGAFFAVVPLALLSLVWQWLSLPSLPPRKREGPPHVIRLLRRKQVALGMASITLLFAGQFALFTYLRPFLETVTAVSVSTLSLILLLMGLAGVAGTYLISGLLQTRLFSVLSVVPIAMAAVAVGLVAFGNSVPITAILLVGWGLLGTAVPVGWGTWLTRAMPDDAEAGGGLQVATIQLAITFGASLGGVLFDGAGWQTTFLFAAVTLVGSSMFAVLVWRATVKP
ncbi:MFS transporter [Rhizobium johnstonii]|uniref:MFS transporter n=1 Tax=Rhizobium TaxID=379 RepID=UPI001030D774|nr:MFS transporter [Rhizobium leguminosarum]TBF69408.1 MFS transporter [Rhizobium leguminosarum]TBG96695.1 MFS transporter [Rhizobium leguminosarum]TBG99774.1 MFS transporter [Rhizobium leguminosarum]TBH30930.1 MFS transporter [Rhizobium leguminosarum]TBH47113.1 MFS transporter [Rhizobium leguminosarum]